MVGRGGERLEWVGVIVGIGRCWRGGSEVEDDSPQGSDTKEPPHANRSCKMEGALSPPRFTFR